MHKQRGIVTEYIVYALAALALLVALVYGIHRYAEGERKAGYAQAEAVYAKRDNEALTKANAVIAQYRAREKAGAEEQVKIVAQLNKDKANALAKKDSTIASIRSGTLILRDPGTSSASSSGTGTTASTGTSGGNAGTGTKLSGTTSEFLIALTGEADEVVRQLQAAQKILQEDRKVCNGNP